MTDTPYALCLLEEAGSTQDEARRRFAGCPLLVVAARQTAGRGRRGRSWETASRALAATLALRLPWPGATRPRLTLVAGLAACRTLGRGVGLEWPNDLIKGSSKIGGLLAEAAGDVVAVGLGVNLYWPAPTVAGAGNLYARDPGVEAAGRLAQTWARDLLRRVALGPEAWGREEYAGCCATLGREVTWEPGGRGRAKGVAADGGLEVETASGLLVLHAGEVHTVRIV